VVHRPHGAPARDRANGQVAERELVDDLRDRVGDLVPQLSQVVTLPRPPDGAALSLEGGAGSFHRSQDVSHADVLRRPCQLVAAR